jgi:NAD(P)H-flavin reductase
MCECCTQKKDIFLPQMATVEDVSQMNITEKYLRLSMDDGQFDFIPGQFVEVSIAGFGRPSRTASSW